MEDHLDLECQQPPVPQKVKTMNSTTTIAVFQKDNIPRAFPATAFTGFHIVNIAVSPDSLHLAAGCENGLSLVWNYKVNVLVRVFSGHTKDILRLRFSPDGRRLISGSYDCTARVWDIQTGLQTCTLQHTQPRGSVGAVAWSPNNALIATGTLNNRALIWTARTGEQLHSFPHRRPVEAVEFSFDGSRLVTCAGSIVLVWDTRSGAAIRAMDDHCRRIHSISVSPTEPYVLTGSEDRTMRFWNFMQSETYFRRFAGAVDCVKSSPDGLHFLAAAAARDPMSPTTEGMLLVTRPDGTPNSKAKWCFQQVDTAAAAYSHDGRSVVIGCLSGEVKLWTLHPELSLLVTLQAHQQSVAAVAFSPDDKELISLSHDGTGRIWRVLDICNMAKTIDEELASTAAGVDEAA